MRENKKTKKASWKRPPERQVLNEKKTKKQSISSSREPGYSQYIVIDTNILEGRTSTKVINMTLGTI